MESNNPSISTCIVPNNEISSKVTTIADENASEQQLPSLEQPNSLSDNEDHPTDWFEYPNNAATENDSDRVVLDKFDQMTVLDDLETTTTTPAVPWEQVPPPLENDDGNNNSNENDAPKKRRRRSSLLRRSLSVGDMKDEKKRILFQQQQQQSGVRQSTIHLAQFLEGVDFELSDDDDDDEVKGGESTIHRSAFHQSLPTRSNVRPVFQRAGSWSNTTADGDGSHILQTANALDVILVQTGNSYRLVPNHTGNNRVQVMIQLQKARYIQLYETMGDTQAVCQDLVDIVQSNYGGKFLIECGQDDYRWLTNEQATIALDSIFRMESGLANQPPSVGTSVSSNQAQEEIAAIQPLSVPAFPTPFALGAAVVSIDAHRIARAELHRLRKKKGALSKLNRTGTNTIERTQSEGVGTNLSLLPIPAAPSGDMTTRSATTGRIGRVTASAGQHAVVESVPNGASASAVIDGTYDPEVSGETNQRHDDEPNLDYEPLDPTRRRSSALSDFSQGMIRDMLSRLGIGLDEDGKDVDLVETTRPTIVEAYDSELLDTHELPDLFENDC